MLSKYLEETGNMYKFILTIIALALNICLYSQEKSDYPSKEEDKYYRNFNFPSFKPIPQKEILNYHPQFAEIKAIQNYKPYSDSLELTPCQDSLLSIISNIKINDSIKIPIYEYVGKIDRCEILKFEKKGDIEAFIYESSELEDNYYGEPGIWIGYSNNSGKDWNYYYTGIVQKQPLFLKWYSQVPLILDDGKIQIEGTLVRQLEPFIQPGPKPKYEVVKDGICIAFDLKVISKDSDKDGLTDILEKKLLTNPNNPDTDGDGIPDNLDLNPRLNFPATPTTMIYETIINNQIPFDSTGVCYISNWIMEKHFVTDTTTTVIIITDCKDLLGVQPVNTRIIFVSEKEYKQNRPLFKTELNRMYVSPLFKVDNMKDTYKLKIRIDTWGEDYLIQKTEKGWLIKEIFTIMI